MKGFITAALAAVATVSEAASIGLQMQQANFDDINITVPVASLQPIGTYRGLAWDGFNVIDVSLAPVGVAAQSNPHVAVQYLLSTGLSSTATLKPASSKVAYFSLQSFYFGCVASSQETAAGVPLACSVTLTGKRDGEAVVTQDISFSSDDLLTSSMRKVTFAGAWNNVDEVEFRQKGLLSVATSVLYDNFEYTTFTTL